MQGAKQDSISINQHPIDRLSPNLLSSRFYLPWMMIFLGAIILLPLIVRIFNRGFNFEILGIIIIGGACLAFGVFLLKNDQLINK